MKVLSMAPPSALSAFALGGEAHCRRVPINSNVSLHGSQGRMIRNFLFAVTLITLGPAAMSQSANRPSVVVVVESFERFTVATGEFDAFKLTARESLGGTSPMGRSTLERQYEHTGMPLQRGRS